MVFFLLHLFALAYAGEWGSTGGEFFRDQHNPWFVKNTTEVNYCIEIDQEGISASPEKVKQLSAQAIQYWKDEFQSRGELLGVGIQKFNLTNRFPEEKCIGTEDLKIQFGYKTLDKEQLQTFSTHNEDPLDYVGIALRTSYDKEKLKGRGFLFISSDRGPYPYNHGSGISKNLWSHDGLLFRILQHELGHVFGIAHTDKGFMAADFPEYMVRNFQAYRTIQARPFFIPPDFFEKCGLKSPPPYEELMCVRVSTEDKWKSIVITGIDVHNKIIPLGTSTFTKRMASKNQFPLKLFLTKEQTVFKALPGELVWKGPARQQFKISAEINTPDTKKINALLELSADGMEVYGVSPTGTIEAWY